MTELEKISIAIPIETTARALLKLKVHDREPWYQVIDRLIAEHYER